MDLAMSTAEGANKRISSGATGFYKNGLPLVWLGIVAVLLIVGTAGILTNIIPRRGWPPFFILPPVFTLVGLLMRRSFRDLLDEVYDAGDHLILLNHRETETVPLTNIMNVSVTTMPNPPRITLRLVKPGRFGPEVSFLTVRDFPLNPFARIPIADDLIVRVDRARSRRIF